METPLGIHFLFLDFYQILATSELWSQSSHPGRRSNNRLPTPDLPPKEINLDDERILVLEST